jgi:hypothetical protein
MNPKKKRVTSKAVIKKSIRDKQKKLFASPHKQLAIIAARNKNKLEEMREQAKVLKLVKKGHTFDEVSQIMIEDHGPEAGMSPKQALLITKQAIDKWCGELALDAKQAKELDLKRIDSLLAILFTEIEPKPMQDSNGFPVLDNATGEPVMTKPDYPAVKLYTDLLARRAKMLGFDADEPSVKVVNEVNIIERRYVGANPDEL